MLKDMFKVLQALTGRTGKQVWLSGWLADDKNMLFCQIIWLEGRWCSLFCFSYLHVFLL